MVFKKHVKLRQERFGAVVFDTLKEKVFVANETAADILRLYNEGKSNDEICDALTDSYDGTPAELKEILNGFFEELKKRELLQ